MSGETEKDISGWTVDTLNAHVESEFRHIDTEFRMLTTMLDERYQTQTKAVDAAFLAQQTAMQTALASAEKAVATALLAAEKAVTKAELAAEKRFDLMNEFRGQLADQAATFMPRSEAEVRNARNDERITELSERFNKSEGHGEGSTDRAAITRVIALAVGTMLISIIGIVVVILIAVL